MNDEEMSDELSQWVAWEHGSDVDTPGCDCGHDGFGPAWHTHDCPGALHAYREFARRAWALAWSYGATLRKVQPVSGAFDPRVKYGVPAEYQAEFDDE